MTYPAPSVAALATRTGPPAPPPGPGARVPLLEEPKFKSLKPAHVVRGAVSPKTRGQRRAEECEGQGRRAGG